MSAVQSTTRAAARLLTALSMRPDLASRITDLHFAVQRDYGHLVALARQRAALEEQLAACQRRLSTIADRVDSSVVAARFGLRPYTENDTPAILGKAA